MNLLDFLIPAAHAQTAGGGQGAGGSMGLTGLALPILLIVVMYFMMIRPQMKRQKEHKSMLDKLGRGDEVITSGGIAGVVAEIGDNFIVVEIADGVRVRVQKGAVGHVLPKGTLKTAN